MPKKNVLVVLGGNSRERYISLESGRACISALKKNGFKVNVFDPKFLSLDSINKDKPNVILNIRLIMFLLELVFFINCI